MTVCAATMKVFFTAYKKSRNLYFKKRKKTKTKKKLVSYLLGTVMNHLCIVILTGQKQ